MSKTNILIKYLIIGSLCVLMFTIIYEILKEPNKIEYPVKLSNVVSEEAIKWEKEKIKPVKLIVYVIHVSSSEEPIIIEDKDVINEALDTIFNIKVTGFADKFDSSNTRTTYLFEDENQKSISFTFQEGLLKTSDGRYYVDDIEKLYSIQGINLPST